MVPDLTGQGEHPGELGLAFHGASRAQALFQHENREHASVCQGAIVDLSSQRVEIPFLSLESLCLFFNQKNSS